MKQLIISSLMILSTTVFSQTVNLACQGIISSDLTSKYPSLNYKGKKDHVRFNVSVDQSTNSLTIGPSYHTAYLKYPNLRIDESGYAINYSASTPKADYTYESLNFYLDRFTGTFKYNTRSEFKSGGILENTITGDCQIGVHWQTRF